MCGRFAVFSSASDLARLFDVDEVRTDPLPARYNVAPSLDVYAVAEARVRGGGRVRRLGALRWGLVAHWREDAKGGPINARSETIAEKPTFRDAFVARRCLVPADGFYEWHTEPGTGRKTPYFVRRADRRPLALAGLWETWRRDGTSDLHTCAIVTTAAAGPVADLHPRMPVMLPRRLQDTWLDRGERDIGRLTALLADVGVPALNVHPVSTEVNDVANDRADLIRPVAR